MELTPREFDAYSNGVLKSRDAETIRMYRHAYWISCWMNGKKAEHLEPLLYLRRTPRVMNDNEMFNQVQAMHKQMGGE